MCLLWPYHILYTHLHKDTTTSLIICTHICDEGGRYEGETEDNGRLHKPHSAGDLEKQTHKIKQPPLTLKLHTCKSCTQLQRLTSYVSTYYSGTSLPRKEHYPLFTHTALKKILHPINSSSSITNFYNQIFIHPLPTSILPIFTTPLPIFTTPLPIFTTPLPIFNHPLPIFNHPLPIFNHPLPILKYSLPIFTRPLPTPLPIFHLPHSNSYLTVTYSQ